MGMQQQQTMLNGSVAQSIPLFENYLPHSEAWDELFTRTIKPHHHSRLLVERLGRLQPTEFKERRAVPTLCLSIKESRFPCIPIAAAWRRSSPLI